MEEYLIKRIEKLKKQNMELEDLLSKVQKVILKQDIRKRELSYQIKSLGDELKKECNLYKYYKTQFENSDD